MVGGETEALQRLKKFAAECQAQPNKGNRDGGNDSIYGANFSCKISPWLAMGCISPRSMFDELKKTVTRYSAKCHCFHKKGKEKEKEKESDISRILPNGWLF